MKVWSASLLAVFCAVQLALAAPAVIQKKPVRAPKARPQPSGAASPALELRAPYEAYAVADAADGRVLEGMNIHLIWPQASLTKLMLACVVVEKIARGELNLDDKVSVSKAAASIGGSQVFLKAGEVFSLGELMQAALIESANDAATAVAEHAAGSAEAFVDLMNRKAQALGLLDTEYFCVHGLPPEKGQGVNITTCSDMVRLALEALKHPLILSWTSMAQTTFRNGTLLLTNKNKLVGRSADVDGLKTGFTRQSGFNIVATAKNGGRRLIVVVLGSPESRIRDACALEKFREHFAN